MRCSCRRETPDLTPHTRRVALWLSGISAVIAFYDPDALWSPLLQLRFVFAVVASASFALAAVGPDRGERRPLGWIVPALAFTATVAALTPSFCLTRERLEGILAHRVAVGTERMDVHRWWYPRAHPGQPPNFAAHDYYGGGPGAVVIPTSPWSGDTFRVRIRYETSDTTETVAGYEISRDTP